jgi:DNA polymerase III alpha subunit (gram-positive type)
MYYLFLDLETTGVNRELNNIWQMSGIVTTGPELQYRILDAFDWKFTPFQGPCEIEALEKGGVTMESLAALPLNANEAYNSLIQLLSKYCDRYNKKDKIQLVAYNAQFDSEFLREFFKKMNDNYYGSWFWTPPICVMQAAAWQLVEERPKLPNFQLSTVCVAAELGWDDTKAHDARYDIFKTYELFKHLQELPQTTDEHHNE